MTALGPAERNFIVRCLNALNAEARPESLTAIDLIRYGIRVKALAPGWYRTKLDTGYFVSEAGQAYIAQMPARRLSKIEELVGRRACWRATQTRPLMDRCSLWMARSMQSSREWRTAEPESKQLGLGGRYRYNAERFPRTMASASGPHLT